MKNQDENTTSSSISFTVDALIGEEEGDYCAAWWKPILCSFKSSEEMVSNKNLMEIHFRACGWHVVERADYNGIDIYVPTRRDAQYVMDTILIQ